MVGDIRVIVLRLAFLRLSFIVNRLSFNVYRLSSLIILIFSWHIQLNKGNVNNMLRWHLIRCKSIRFILIENSKSNQYIIWDLDILLVMISTHSEALYILLIHCVYSLSYSVFAAIVYRFKFIVAICNHLDIYTKYIN